MTDDETGKVLTAEEAKAMLDVQGEGEEAEVHCFMDAAGSDVTLLIGADWGLASVHDMIDREAGNGNVRVSGPGARGMGHGLCINDSTDHQEPRFFATKQVEK